MTGATGIAAATARRLSESNARVFVISLHQDECQELARDVGLNGWAAADLTNEDAAIEAFASAREALGGMDGLAVVAGGSGRRFGDGMVHEMSLAAWEATLSLNVGTSFNSVRPVVGPMVESGGGSIVLISSVLASHPVPDMFATHAYAAAKGAQQSLARAMAAQYAADRIRVNVVAPGLVRTPMAGRAASDPDILDFAGRKQPLAGGMLEPEDIAGAICFLLSDDSSLITGQVLHVDGGWSVSSASP